MSLRGEEALIVRKQHCTRRNDRERNHRGPRGTETKQGMGNTSGGERSSGEENAADGCGAGRGSEAASDHRQMISGLLVGMESLAVLSTLLEFRAVVQGSVP